MQFVLRFYGLEQFYRAHDAFYTSFVMLGTHKLQLIKLV